MSSATTALASSGKLCSYAALILHEEQLDITGENIAKLIKASQNSVAPFLPSLFAKSLEGVDIKQLLISSLAVGAAAPAVAATAGATGDAEAEAPAEEDKASESSEESMDGDIGLSLFD